jgi:hypothetical protein
MTRFSDIVETARDQQDTADGANGSGESNSDQQQGWSTESDGIEEPAFPFSEASQEQVYPRASTYQRFEDFRDFELKRELRDRGLRGVSGRELDEALLKLAMAHEEEYADLVEDGRRGE